MQRREALAVSMRRDDEERDEDDRRPRVSRSTVTKIGSAAAAIRLSRPWWAYPIPCSVAGTATIVTSNTKRAPSGVSRRSTPVIGRSSEECNAIGWPLASTWIAAIDSSTHDVQTSTDAVITLDERGSIPPQRPAPRPTAAPMTTRLPGVIDG